LKLLFGSVQMVVYDIVKFEYWYVSRFDVLYFMLCFQWCNWPQMGATFILW